MRTFVLRARAAPTDSKRLLAAVGQEAHTEILAHTQLHNSLVFRGLLNGFEHPVTGVPASPRDSKPASSGEPRRANGATVTRSGFIRRS